MTTALKGRLVDLATTTGRDLRAINARIDGDLATAEKNNLVGAINELAGRVPVNIAVGASPPANPSLNDLWVDTA